MTAPNPHTSDVQGPNLITHGDDQYAAWYTLAGELRIGKRIRATQTWGVNHTEHQISGGARSELQTPVAADNHNYPAIAVDGLGYIHVWANMHSSPLQYIVSTNPGDITSWELGVLPGDNAPFTRWTYPMPVPLPDGTLVLFFRAGAELSGSGRSNSYYWTRAPDAAVWVGPTLLWQGLEVPGAGPGGANGSNGTVDDATNWNAYPTMPAIDDNGRLHISWCWRESETDSRSNTRPSYAVFDAAAGTWRAVDGTLLTLPITPLNNPACRTGLVSNGEGYLNWGGLAIDGDGRPHAFVSRNPHYHQWWDGDAWQQETFATTVAGGSLDGHLVLGRFNVYWFRGRLWVATTGGPGSNRVPRLWRADGAASVALGGGVGATTDWEVHADPEAYRRFGSIEVLTPDGSAPVVASFGINARMAAAA